MTGLWKSPSFFRVLVIMLCFLQSFGNIGCSSARAQAVSQLSVQNGNYLIHFRAGLKTGNNYPSSTSIENGSVKGCQGTTDACQSRADYTYNFSSFVRNDWCSAYALYRYTLKKNGTKEFQIPEWERSLRRYCSRETEFWD